MSGMQAAADARNHACVFGAGKYLPLHTVPASAAVGYVALEAERK